MKKWLCAAAMASALCVGQASACTIVTAVTDDTVLFAANEDQSPNPVSFVVDRTGTYGVVNLATPMPGIPLVMQTGVNEKGLIYDINALAPENLRPVGKSLRQDEWALTKLMRESATVNEVLAKIFTYDWGRSIAYQIHLADASGDAAVIHAGRDGKLTFTRIDRKKGYLVSTNFNLRDVDQKAWLASRYLTADGRMKALSTSKQVSARTMASLLNATHQESSIINSQKTIYSTIIDLKTLDIHLYDNSRFDVVYVLNVRSELAKVTGRQITPLPKVLAAMKPR